MRRIILKRMLWSLVLFQALLSSSLAADEIWVAPGNNLADRAVGAWAVTSSRATLFSFGVPEQMNEFESATVVLIGRQNRDVTYDLDLAVSRNGASQDDYTDLRLDMGPLTLVRFELLEIDVSDIIRDAESAIGPLSPGQDYLTLRFSLDMIAQAWVIGLRVRFDVAKTAHTHAGEDIVSGTVAEPYIDAIIARDDEVTTAIQDHAGIPGAHHARYTDSEAIAAVLSGGGAAQVKRVTFTGTHPTNQDITGIGFQPQLVVVFSNCTNNHPFFKDAVMPGDNYMWTNGENGYPQHGVTILSDGFRVSDNSVNRTGCALSAWCLRID